MRPELDPRYMWAPVESAMIEFGKYGRVIAVPAVFVDVLMGMRVVEFVLAAYTLVVVLPETVAVTKFMLNCGGRFTLQSGLLQVAVIDAVPAATAVSVAGLLPVVPVAAVTAAGADDAQVRFGLIYWPALSYTSAVSGCVPPVLSVKDVLEEPASCTRM